MQMKNFLILSLSLAVACQNYGGRTRSLNYSTEETSAWNYFRTKYDADGDGSVGKSEYDRRESAFARLDRTGDGRLQAEDFAPPYSVRRSIVTEVLATRVMFGYFQENGDPKELTLDELFTSAESLDSDGNEILDEFEFRSQAEQRFEKKPVDDIALMLGERDPWTVLVHGIDLDGDGTLSFSEFETFFEDVDNGDYTLTLHSETQDGNNPNRVPVTGPRVGQVAPDFELCPPGGGKAVKLSSFAGRRPVALIFGSYT
ncbi:MAG: hypothetical protein CMJ89_10530 [Planctomycetes bacterium]|jgi:Ca2+-binding EF-hand superfamily protein|nr:hypothetical protein [Planctomycetota bacterium]